MTSTHPNQPTIPRLQIDLDEILGTIALELARVRICDQCQQSVPSLIDDLSDTWSPQGHPARRPSWTRPGWTGPTCAPRCAPRSPRTPTASQTRCGTSGTS